tara:strand:+ start:380 stop:676 length:297 start_codon:yes stop_codon:yes gene_type:complete
MGDIFPMWSPEDHTRDTSYVRMLYGGPYHERSVSAIVGGVENCEIKSEEEGVLTLTVPPQGSIRECEYILREFPHLECHFWLRDTPANLNPLVTSEEN